MLRQLAAARTPWLTDVANAINGAGSGLGARLLGLLVVALMIAFRRWRHLAVLVGGLLFLEVVGQLVYYGLSRPRPYGVPVIGGWAGYASGSPFVGVLTFYLLGIVYCLAAPGRARSRARAATAALVTLFALARTYRSHARRRTPTRIRICSGLLVRSEPVRAYTTVILPAEVPAPV